MHERAIADTLRTFALGPDEVDALATLRRSGSPYQLNPKHLRQLMMITSATMTHRLDKLEERGLIHRSSDPSDRPDDWMRRESLDGGTFGESAPGGGPCQMTK